MIGAPVDARSEILSNPVVVDRAAGDGLAAPGGDAGSGLPAELIVLFETAVAQERAGELDAAAGTLAALLRHAPNHPQALHLSGIVLFRQGYRGEALALLRRAVRAGLNTPLAWRNLCEALRVQGHLDEALAAGQRAVRSAPNDPSALHNLAVVHAQRGELDTAIACDRRALDHDPNHVGANFGLAESLLKLGDFAEGLEHYRWRFRLPGAAIALPPGGAPIWDGRPLSPGRLLLVADQGFGDAIQFSRYLSWAAERCPAPLLACDRALAPLLSGQGGASLFHRWQDIPAHDALLPLSGLPRIAGTRLDTIPAVIPYLHAAPDLVTVWTSRLDKWLPAGFRRVGLVWAGRPTHANDHNRSATLRALGPLFEMEDIAWVALQLGDRQSDIGDYVGRAPLLNLGPELAGWGDTAAVLSVLDAVVSVDTAVAHLAGALGRPMHLMLPHAGEWRWLHHRDDSPWYPSMRLHRQPRPGDWHTVAHAVRAALGH